MKPVLATRPTTCYYCGKTIERGSERLDDLVRLNERVVRFYYHKDCFIQKINVYFQNTEFKPETRPGSGKKAVLDLTLEQHKYRRNLIARLSALKKYYLPQLNLLKDPSQLTPREVERFTRFHERRQAILAELEKVGGIPPSQDAGWDNSNQNGGEVVENEEADNLEEIPQEEENVA